MLELPGWNDYNIAGGWRGLALCGQTRRRRIQP